MPTPVKTPVFPVPAVTKPALAVVTDNAGGERFEDELVRRRRSEPAEKPEPTRKAEPRRAPKGRRPTKPGRNEAPAPVEEAEIRCDPAEGGAAPAEDVEPADAPAADAVPAAELGETKADPEPAPQGAVAAAVVPTVVTEAAAVDSDTDEAADAETRPGQSSPRPVVVPGMEGAESDEVGGAASSAAASEGAAGDFGALLPEGSPDSGENAPKDERPAAAAQRPGTGDGLEGTESRPEFQADVTGPDPAARVSSDAPPPAALTTALAEAKAEARPAPAQPPTAPPVPSVPPEVRFAAANHEHIVTSMRAEVLPNGGSMRLRLDPPQLGAMQVTVQIQDGMITAAFETTSDEATRLLGHSLNQLKSVLESHGVAVDKLQVQQAPREAQTSNAHDDGRREQGSQSQEQEQNARQEQQRREMLQRMWRRLAGGQDPLDLTA